MATPPGPKYKEALVAQGPLTAGKDRHLFLRSAGELAEHLFEDNVIKIGDMVKFKDGEDRWEVLYILKDMAYICHVCGVTMGVKIENLIKDGE